MTTTAVTAPTGNGRAAVEQGTGTMWANGIDKVRAGITSLAEVTRVVAGAASERSLT